MSNLLRASMATVAVLFGVAIASGCGTGSRGVVAVVGSTTITQRALEHWISVRAAMGQEAVAVVDPGGRARDTRWTLDFLIAATRSLGIAAQDGITVTDAEAQKTLERARYELLDGFSLSSGSRELAALISSKAETPSDQLWIVRVHMLAERVAQRQLADATPRITDAQLAAYFARHKALFVLPERRDVAVIETFARAKAVQAKREIESGRGLIEVMMRRNDEPDVGGLKLGLSRKSLRHAYEENYFTSKPHHLVGPLQAEIYYLLEVTRIHPARSQTLREARSAIRRSLIEAARRASLPSALRAVERRWKAVTRCQAAYMVPECGAKLA